MTFPYGVVIIELYFVEHILPRDALENIASDAKSSLWNFNRIYWMAERDLSAKMRANFHLVALQIL